VAGPTLAIGTAARPYSGETVSGDGWSIDWHEGVCRVALIDGLGHGSQAAAATRAATTALTNQPELSPAEALRLCHRALAGTRGAVISIARIDLAGGRLTYAGVGNVEARLWHPPTHERPISYRGVLGSTIPTIRSFDFPLPPDWVLILHTDGISSRFDIRDVPDSLYHDPQALADELLQRWSRTTDDATVVVIRPTR
jgi:serine phosphatase RsbU (regulator of sigma subunit)